MPNGPDYARRLADLLRDPRETLDVELKGWLEIDGNAEHKATLAKALIAQSGQEWDALIRRCPRLTSVVDPTRKSRLTVMQPKVHLVCG